MVDSVKNIQQYNYNTVANVKLNNVNDAAKVSAAPVSNPVRNIIPFCSSDMVVNKRTELSSQEEKQKYTELLKFVDKNTKKQLGNFQNRVPAELVGFAYFLAGQLKRKAGSNKEDNVAQKSFAA